jgi:hypothetical protein
VPELRGGWSVGEVDLDGGDRMELSTELGGGDQIELMWNSAVVAGWSSGRG